jgi:IS5 family transposase
MEPAARSWRLGLGALIIKEKLGISARETVEQIRENPYLQYFIGQSSYSNEASFDPSLLVNFRQRISVDTANKINQQMVKRIRETADSKSEKNKLEAESYLPKNRVKLIIDATSAAADISYRTDLGLLNDSRPHTEKIRDTLYKPVKVQVKKKPRTYRLKAKKDYLKVAKQLRLSRNQKRKAINKQL